MGELQATIELALHLHKFYNVDLFQRGYYQIRLFLRSTPKLPTKLELSLPQSTVDWKGGGGLVFPSCVVNGAAVSKTFQILYRNEEVNLDDSAFFKLHLILDSHKVAESLDRIDLQLLVELWFTESNFGPDHHNAIQCVSSRTLLLHFVPKRGIHYHIPVLFDYFHLSAVTLTIHAVLISLHQPYINGGKSAKAWSSPKVGGRTQQSNMENVFFGGLHNTVRCSGGLSGNYSWRLTEARLMHRSICTLLLAANSSLAVQLESMIAIQEGSVSGEATSSTTLSSTMKIKMDNLSDVAKECYFAVTGGQVREDSGSILSDKSKSSSKIQSVECEEDFLVTANSDISSLCAENILLWKEYLAIVSGSEAVRQHLAREHHILRMDGDCSTLPVVFEDQYQHVADFARRRSVTTRKSDNFINTSDIKISVEELGSSEDKGEVMDIHQMDGGEKAKSENGTLQLSKHGLDEQIVSKRANGFNTLRSQGDANATIVSRDDMTKYGTHPLKSPSQRKSIFSTLTPTRSSSAKKEKESEPVNDDSPQSHHTVNGSVFLNGDEMKSKSRNCGEVDSPKPPVPPRTDKMPRDFKPPIPPKFHKLPRSSLKEKLKNNLRLEIKVPSEENKKTKFRVKLIERAHHFRGNNPKRKKAKPISNADSVLLLKYRKLEPSLSMPYNLSANIPSASTPGANTPSASSSINKDEKSMKHSQSTLSVPAFLWELAHSPSTGVTESLPDLLASDSESSSDIKATQTHPPKVRRKPPTLSNVQVGLVSASDEALMEVGKKANLSKGVSGSSPTKKSLSKLRAERRDSDSNSDITSEQSGWVSNSSRQSPGSSSQPSPELNVKTFPLATLSVNSGFRINVDRSARNESLSSANTKNSKKSSTKVKILPGNESLLQDRHQSGLESTIKSASNDQLHITSTKSPIKKEVKKSQSLQKVSTPPRQAPPSPRQAPPFPRQAPPPYERGLLPPPPKQFQDPSPGKKRLLKADNVGRLQREELVAFGSKDRPRSESPRTENKGNEAQEKTGGTYQSSKNIYWSANSKPRSDFNLDDFASVEERLSDVINEVKKSVKTQKSRDKFNSLPSMKKRHQNASRKTAKELPNNAPKTPELLSYHQLDSFLGLGLNDRTRTQSAPPPPHHEHAIEPRTNKTNHEHTIEPRTNKMNHEHTIEPRAPKTKSKQQRDEPLSHLVANKCTLLDLFLEQQEASVWGQRGFQSEIEKETQVTPVVKVHKSLKVSKRSNVKESRKKSRSQPDLNYVYDVGVPKSSSPSRTESKCTCPSDSREKCKPEEFIADLLPQKLNLRVSDDMDFVKAKEEFKLQINFQGVLYSDITTLPPSLPYFYVSDDSRALSPDGLHLIVCVHGLDGNSADLRLIKTYLEIGLPGANLDFLMSERNQGDTFSDFETLTDRLVSEILYHLEFFNLNPNKISFVGHSLGNIIIRGVVSHPQMKPHLPKLHTLFSLSGPHLGTLYNNSGLVNMGMWFMQKWKKSGSLLQLALKDRIDIRQTYLYKLSQRSQLHNFKNVLLCGSSQDRYVPLHSARIELCHQAVRDNSVIGAAYREMVSNILQPIICNPSVTLVRFDIHHALPSTANSLIGRAAHIAVLDSELFIEKFFLVTGIKYFK